MTTTTRFKYGWVRDLPDHRDHVLSFSTPAIVVPKQLDLRVNCREVYNQGQLGSCTANAIAGLLQYDEVVQGKLNQGVPSRLFIYWNERFMEGTVNYDNGAQIRDGIKSLNKWGFCDEALWPYSDDTTSRRPLFIQKPSAAAFASAKKEIITQYARIAQTAAAIKTCLAVLGRPIVFGFSVYQSFETAEVAQTGVVPMPGYSEQLLGGHAVLIVGYNDDTQMFIVRNSWGEGWGDQGYMYMPYAYVLDANLANDFWTVTFVP